MLYALCMKPHATKEKIMNAFKITERNCPADQAITQKARIASARQDLINAHQHHMDMTLLLQIAEHSNKDGATHSVVIVARRAEAHARDLLIDARETASELGADFGNLMSHA